MSLGMRSLLQSWGIPKASTLDFDPETARMVAEKISREILRELEADGH